MAFFKRYREDSTLSTSVKASIEGAITEDEERLKILERNRPETCTIS